MATTVVYIVVNVPIHLVVRVTQVQSNVLIVLDLTLL